jgi:hypothetical protein
MFLTVYGLNMLLTNVYLHFIMVPTRQKYLVQILLKFLISYLFDLSVKFFIYIFFFTMEPIGTFLLKSLLDCRYLFITSYIRDITLIKKMSITFSLHSKNCNEIT